MTAAYPLIARNLIKLTLNSAILVLLLVGQGWAQSINPNSAELCGNGIDDGSISGTAGSCPGGYVDATLGLGCDKICPGVDADHDGYTSNGSLGKAGTTYTDCDDSRRDVYPGVIVPNDRVTPTGYKTCQTNGTYTSVILNATTPLCEATGSGVCKYIHCGTGNNSNAGTYAAPYLTLGKIAGGSGGSPPASPYTLQAGDVVYLLGGTCSTTYNDAGAIPIHAELTASGTLANPITIKRYPGSTATITGGTRTFVVVGDHYKFEDLDIDPTGAAFYSLYAQTNFELARSYIHDLAANGNTNQSCLHFDPVKSSNIHHNFFRDCLRASGNVGNVAAIHNLIGANELTGVYNKIQFNNFWFTTKDSASNGAALFHKHGTRSADCSANGCFDFSHNYVVNASSAVSNQGSGLRMRQNIVYNAVWLSAQTSAEPNNGNEDNIATDNVVDFILSAADGGVFSWGIPTQLGTEKYTLTDNVIIDRRTVYLTGNNDGVYSIGAYGPDSQFTSFQSTDAIVSDSNCFYTPSVSLNLSYFRVPSGGGGYGPAGNLGADYTLASWRTATGEDALSFNEDPVVDADYLATSANCLDKGRWLEAPPAPTPTPTPTPVPSSNLPSVFPR